MTGRGLSYSWGGGGKGGPSCGISSPSPGGYVDYNRYGDDCSGFTLFAYWSGALGDNEMLEAAPPRGPGSVQRTSVYGSHAEVVRVIG